MIQQVVNGALTGARRHDKVVMEYWQFNWQLTIDDFAVFISVREFDIINGGEICYVQLHAAATDCRVRTEEELFFSENITVLVLKIFSINTVLIFWG